jgi:hypothetical protein
MIDDDRAPSPGSSPARTTSAGAPPNPLKRKATTPPPIPGHLKHLNHYVRTTNRALDEEGEMKCHRISSDSCYGTISPTNMGRPPWNLSAPEIAFCVQDRNHHTFQAMSYIDMNFMLVDMIPTMKNLINGKVIAPGSKHTILQKISSDWTLANTSSADPLEIKTCAFDTRFPAVLAALKEEGAACARNPDTQHLVIDQGKVKILDITAYSLIQWLLTSNGANASPSVGASMYAAYFMLQKRIGIRACQESANILKRHFTEDNSYGWPVLVQQSDLPTKNHKLDKKLKIVLPEKHYIVDPVLIALMKYLLNLKINPGETVFNHPLYGQGSRDRAWPHFKLTSYAGSTIGNWTQDKIKQYITNYPRLMTQPYSLAQIFPGGPDHYIKGGKFSLSNTSFRKAATQLHRKFGVPEFVANATEQRSNKNKGSRGVYDEFSALDAVKLALLQHFPPLIPKFEISISEIPSYPGPRILARLRADVRFYADGSVVPVDLKKMQSPSPLASIHIEPVRHEFKVMEAANEQKANHANVSNAYLNPNSLDAQAAQATTFGVIQNADSFKQQASTHQNLQVSPQIMYTFTHLPYLLVG